MAWLPFRGCCSDASSPTYQLTGPSEQWVVPTKFWILETKPPSKGLGLPLAPLDFQTFLQPWLGMVWRVAGSRLSADQSYTTCSTQVKGFATFEEHFCRGHERDACSQASLVFRMTLPGLCFGGCPLEVCLSLMRMHFGRGYILLSLPAVKPVFFSRHLLTFLRKSPLFSSVRDFCIMMVKKMHWLVSSIGGPVKIWKECKKKMVNKSRHSNSYRTDTLSNYKN